MIVSGLSVELYNRCYAVFRRCDEFVYNRRLRAVFVVDELETYRERIPEGSSLDARIAGLLDLFMGRFARDRRPILALFLEALATLKTPNDQLYQELSALQADIERETARLELIDVPFVVVAMNYYEAQQIFDQPTLASLDLTASDRLRLQNFITALREEQVPNLRSCYEANRENWTPHSYQQPIRAIIEDVIVRCNLEDHSLQVRPRFVSETFFTTDPIVRQQQWSYIGQRGGVLLIDSASLFHPYLRDTLLQSQLLANENVAMLILSPVESNTNRVNQRIEEQLITGIQVAFQRFAVNWDRLCEVGYGEVRALQRWVTAILPETARVIAKQQPKRANIAALSRRMGYVPRGLEETFVPQAEL